MILLIFAAAIVSMALAFVLLPLKLMGLAYLAALAIFLELVHQAPRIGEDEEW